MQYFFIFGRHPLLSLAELNAYLKKEYAGNKISAIAGDQSACIVQAGEEIDIGKTIKDLGGTIKIGEIKLEVRSKKLEERRRSFLNNMIDLIVAKKPEGKINFGVSVYGTDKINIKHLGMDVKTGLKEQGISARWVASKEKNLSSVVVETNHLLDKGMEIVIIKTENDYYIGNTMAVQPFRELSFRDYGRPTRDDLSGMLPPKLAKIMINLSGVSQDAVILDPFCGSGTILTEALLMEYKNLIGSDMSEKAIENTAMNIEWIKEKFKVRSEKLKIELINLNISELEKKIIKNSIDAIVTEPYLGPQRGRINIERVKTELETLYAKSFDVFNKILKPGGRIVMVWPVFSIQQSRFFLEVSGTSGFNLIDPLKGITEQDKPSVRRKNAEGRGLLYFRPGQKVMREILIFEKN